MDDILLKFRRFCALIKNTLIGLGMLLAAGPALADMDEQPNIKPSVQTQESSQEDKNQIETSELAGTSWQLLQIQSMDDTVEKPSDPALYTLEFKPDGTANLRADCNRATGKWTSSSAGQLSFGPMAATKAMCPPESLHDKYLEQFQWVRSYILKEGHLFLATMIDGSILEFEPIQQQAETEKSNVPAAPEDGGPRDWQVTETTELRDATAKTAQVLTTYQSGDILDNLGCTQVDQSVWCDVQKLGGGARGYVELKFLKPAVAPDGQVAMGPDDSALRAGQGDFDATGQIPCAQFAGQPMTQCEMGVARAGGGYATVVVTHADGRTRIIFFRFGIPIGADSSEADKSGPFKATKEKDLHLIHVGDERYEIVDAVIFGG